jgi:hypothetical protein
MGDSDKLPDSGPASYRFVEHRRYLDALLEALDVAASSAKCKAPSMPACGQTPICAKHRGRCAGARKGARLRDFEGNSSPACVPAHRKSARSRITTARTGKAREIIFQQEDRGVIFCVGVLEGRRPVDVHRQADAMKRKRRVYKPRVVGDRVMTSADLERLHKYVLDIEHID